MLVDQMHVRLPNGRVVNLLPGLIDFEASPWGFVARYADGDRILTQGVRADNAEVAWQMNVVRGIMVALCDDRHTVMLPSGANTFEGQIGDVRQVDDTFVILVHVPGGTARFMQGRVSPGHTPPANAIVGLDSEGKERWRRYGYDAISHRGGGPGTIVARDEFWRWKLDARTGEELDSQQLR